MKNSEKYSGTPIAQVPFSRELIDLLLPEIAGRLNCVFEQPFEYMIELLDVDEETFLSWRNAGRAKREAFQKLINFLSSQEGQSKFVEAYDSCFAIHEYPCLSVEDDELTFSEKIDLAIKQYILGVEAIAKYKVEIKENLERLKLFFIEKCSKKEIAKRLKLKSTERVRQLKIGFLEKMSDGGLKHATNLMFSSSFKDEIEDFISHLPTICSHKTLCEALQCDDYEETAASVFLPLKSAPKDGNALSKQENNTFDQLYYIRKEDGIRWARTYLKAICGVLGYGSEIFDVRPLDIDEIMSLLEQSNSDFNFDKDFVLEILEQHTWIEQLIVDDEVKYQLKYEKLNKYYQQVARIVYERKPLKLKILDIDAIHREKINDAHADSITTNIGNAKKKISWLVYGGQNGWVEYNETGESRLNIKRAVEQWISEQRMFCMKDLLSYLKEMGYANLSELTIRSYVTDNCAVDNNDHDCFCNWEFVQDYSNGYSWRRQSQQGMVNWVIRMVHGYLMSAPEHALPLSEVNVRLIEDASNTDEGYEMRNNAESYLARYIGDKEGIFELGKDKVLKLTKAGESLEAKKLEKIAVRSRRPGYYDVVVAKIMALLNDADNGEMRLNDLQKECLEDIGDKAISAFYRIVDKYLPEQVVKIYKECKTYLKLEKAKIEYVQPMVVASVEDDKTLVESPIVVEDKHERYIREAGQPIYVDWKSLRKDIIFNLGFYARQWELPISFEESVDKFIRFINQLDVVENNRLAVQIPRNFVQLWNYQNDIYSYMGYMTNIVICYERLLREIYLKNTGELIEAQGLVDTINQFADVSAWRYQYDTSLYHKSLRKIGNERNKITHGEEFSQSLTDIILNTSNYIALYIYTVARFWNE